jgi:hypothetical protein
MKNAIGRFDRCLSELDIKRRRLTVLSWMPPGGKTQEIRPCFTGTLDFCRSAWAAACVLATAWFEKSLLVPLRDVMIVSCDRHRDSFDTATIQRTSMRSLASLLE